MPELGKTITEPPISGTEIEAKQIACGTPRKLRKNSPLKIGEGASANLPLRWIPAREVVERKRQVKVGSVATPPFAGTDLFVFENELAKIMRTRNR
jgi:hypothetical protein